MNDYGEMRRAVERINDRLRSLEGIPCPRGACFGTLRRVGGALTCDACGDAPASVDRGPFSSSVGVPGGPGR